MAGDNKTTDNREQVPAIDYADPFPGIAETLDDILLELRGTRSEGAGMYEILPTGGIGFAPHQWDRIKTASLVVNCSAAGTVTLAVGSFLRSWNVGVGVTTIPYITTIERGTDIALGGTAVGLTGYLIATPDPG